MIYLLSRTDEVDWDEYEAKVVRAATEAEARDLANRDVGDEGRIWLDPELVTCEVVDPNGEARVILESFNAG